MREYPCCSPTRPTCVEGREPSRLRGYLGAARAAKAAGDTGKARANYERLVGLAATADTERPEIREAKAFLGR